MPIQNSFSRLVLITLQPHLFRLDFQILANSNIKMYANSEATDQTLRSAAADLALHRSPISY